MTKKQWIQSIQPSLECFNANAEPFFIEMAVLFFQCTGCHLTSISVPQSVMCYQTSDYQISLKLRLVLLPNKNGVLLGRLSWLDWKGVDHVCCYINETFESVVMVSGNHWKKNIKSAEVLCLERFGSIQTSEIELSQP